MNIYFSFITVYVQDILHKVVDECGMGTGERETELADAPPPLCEGAERLLKQEAVLQNQTRFAL